MFMTYAVILAGGKGGRLKAGKPKQFLPLGNKSILIKTIEAFQNINEIDLIIPVIPQEFTYYFHDEIKKWKMTKLMRPVMGGSTRQGSVYNALNSVSFNAADLVILHDAARPFVSKKIINDIIVNVSSYGAAGTYVRAIDTITEIESGFVKSIPARENLYYAQTPQGFRYRIIRDSHEKAMMNGIINATDDVSLALDAGYEVKIVEGSYRNFKITTLEDYNLSKELAKNSIIK